MQIIAVSVLACEVQMKDWHFRCSAGLRTRSDEKQQQKEEKKKRCQSMTLIGLRPRGF